MWKGLFVWPYRQLAAPIDMPIGPRLNIFNFVHKIFMIHFCLTKIIDLENLELYI